MDLSVGEGEFFGLLGPNGAGKTTLFKILATLVLPDGGTATVGGLDVARDPGRVRRLLAPVIPSERSLYWRISAEENLLLFAALYGIHGREARARVRELLEILGLSDVGGKQVGLFSTGMRQRLLIARALLARPRVLLLDEPTRSLDPLAARELRAFLKDEIQGRRNCTVLLATHDHEEVVDLCDRVGVLHRGRLLAVGATEEIAERLGARRYRIRTRTPSHPAVKGLEAGPEGAAGWTMKAESDGWTRVEFDLPGGEEVAARLLRSLASEGAVVSSFQRVRPSLADLIDRIVRHGDGEP